MQLRALRLFPSGAFSSRTEMHGGALINFLVLTQSVCTHENAFQRAKRRVPRDANIFIQKKKTKEEREGEKEKSGLRGEYAEVGGRRRTRQKEKKMVKERKS